MTTDGDQFSVLCAHLVGKFADWRNDVHRLFGMVGYSDRQANLFINAVLWKALGQQVKAGHLDPLVLEQEVFKMPKWTGKRPTPDGGFQL